MNTTPTVPIRSPKYYGWTPDLPDRRDHLFAISKPIPLPASVDLRPLCPPVVDQLELGSCTANAIAAAYQFEQMRQNESGAFAPSRLFIYFNEREIEGSIDFDSGAMLRDGIKSIAKLGVCPESLWPYDIARFAERPTPDTYQAALSNQAISYRRIRRYLRDMMSCLASGLPFVFGFTVYEEFESDELANTGMLAMPGTNSEILGGHAVLCVGYDQAKRCFLIRNSWGEDWGLSGYYWMPMEYLSDPDLSDDRWVISKVE